MASARVATILPQVNWQLLREAALRLGLNNPSVLRQALQYAEVWELGDVERERLALHLVEVEDKRYREASAILGIKLENFKMVVCRARKKIVRHMNRMLGEDES